LSIVRQLVEMHGGSVRAESDGPGAGATFTVALPLSPLDLDVGSAKKLEGPSPSIAGLSILVVENDAEGRELLSRLLEMRGATAVTAGSGTEATTILDDNRIDVILSDIGMPEEDGYELARRIRERESGTERHIPAIALTAYAGRADRKRALAAGFDEHLAKPISPEVLIATIAKLAGG
jgi:CheY-like chemotaxis protein